METKKKFTHKEEEELYNDLEKRLDSLVRGKSMFLNPNITLTSLAQLLLTNRTYASRVINRRKKVTFNNYINKFRIERAVKLLIEDDYLSKKSLIDLSKECGFSSISTFRRFFMKSYQMTPIEYVKKHKAEE